jgi:hypothetical protein
MKKVIIDLTPRQELHNPQKGFGREVLRNVYYRIDVPYYTYTCGHWSDKDKEAKMGHENSRKFMYEVVEILQAAGWTLATTEWQQEYSGACPQLTKGNQRLYCHPQSISGEVNVDEVDVIEGLFAQAKTFKHYHTDNYRDVIVTTSTEDEILLYHQTHDSTVRKVLEELTTTKRRNLYKSENEVFYKLFDRLRIDTKRAGQIYNHDGVEQKYANEVFQKAKADGWLITAKGRNDMNLIRWANKAEQKAINK